MRRDRSHLDYTLSETWDTVLRSRLYRFGKDRCYSGSSWAVLRLRESSGLRPLLVATARRSRLAPMTTEPLTPPLPPLPFGIAPEQSHLPDRYVNVGALHRLRWCNLGEVIGAALDWAMRAHHSRDSSRRNLRLKRSTL